MAEGYTISNHDNYCSMHKRNVYADLWSYYVSTIIHYIWKLSLGQNWQLNCFQWKNSKGSNQNPTKKKCVFVLVFYFLCCICKCFFFVFNTGASNKTVPVYKSKQIKWQSTWLETPFINETTLRERVNRFFNGKDLCKYNILTKFMFFLVKDINTLKLGWFYNFCIHD